MEKDDLGGEGIAPEDHRLTQNLDTSDIKKQPPYRPDDGLPRPPGYQQSLEQLNQQRSSLLESVRSRAARLTENEGTAHSSSPLLDQSNISTQVKADEYNSVSSPPQAIKSDEPKVDSSASNHPNENALPADSQHKNDLSLPNVNGQSSSIARESTISDTLAAEHTEIPKCPHALSGPTRLSKRTQLLMLNSLHQRLGQERTKLIQRTPIKITLKVKQNRTVHRCDLITKRQAKIREKTQPF